MAYEYSEGQGALFKNEKRENDRQPNLRGQLKVDGRLYDVSAWRRRGTKGKADWLSLKAELAGSRSQQRRRAAQQPERDVNDEDVPF